MIFCELNKYHFGMPYLIDRSGRITSLVTNKEYNTRSQVTCRSNNIVYCLICTKCGKQYVGQTKRPLVERLREHMRNINQNTDIHIVGKHFNESDHNGIKSQSVQIINFAKGHPDSKSSLTMRLELESMWIKRLRSYIPTGLNLAKTSERNYDTYEISHSSYLHTLGKRENKYNNTYAFSNTILYSYQLQLQYYRMKTHISIKYAHLYISINKSITPHIINL